MSSSSKSMTRPHPGLEATALTHTMRKGSHSDTPQSSNALHAVSLFSNCGAGDLGYARAGFRFTVMAELEEKRLRVALLNHRRATGIAGDLRTTWPRVVDAYVKAHGSIAPALLAACPPCQGMSSARSNRGYGADPDAGSRESRNLLAYVILQVAHALSPRVIVVENVPAFLTRRVRHPSTHQPVSAASLLIGELERDYVTFPLLVDLADYGVPQTRRRAFLTFIRRTEAAAEWLAAAGQAPYSLPTRGPRTVSRPHITLKQALEHFALPPLDAATDSQAAAPTRPLHAVPVWNAHRHAMVAAIPKGSGASAWENNCCAKCGPVRVSLKSANCPSCGGALLRPVVKSANGRYRLVRGFRSSSYRRMNPDRPAATITTASGHIGSDLTIHPFENRVLSPLECALLQTFPRNFRWGDALHKWGQTNVRAMIGEAVPPRFTELHGRALLSLLQKTNNRRFISITDIRCTRPAARLGLADGHE
ncbi:MAG: DNA cytosine methyltransferase [Planctomycetaceae bacterium]|nr:DNA cytosine methyltransferase [Planctomycetaceae bacterium]